VAKANVLALAQTIGGNFTDAVAIDKFYTEIVNAWAATPGFLTNATLVQVPAANRFTFAGSIIELRAVIWDQTELSKLTLREVESLNPEWRNEKGAPRAYILEGETTKTVALYPAPAIPAQAFTGGGGEPLGADYPTYSVVLIHTEVRTDVLVYLELPLALLIVEREFIRESDHRDAAFATAAGDFGRALLQLVQ